MDLRKTILAEHSKANCDKIVRWVGHSQKKFDELFNLFLVSEYRINQRAAWPLSYCVISHPHFISKHFPKLVKNLHRPGIHDSVKRNTLRLLQHIEIPKKFHGEIMDICFRYLSSPDEPVAIKAFSLTVLHHLSKPYPEIRNEIRLIIEERWEHETAAFHSKAKKFLKS
ncbi:MAG TPA: hypothetical protein VFP87_07985 [Chitinophagaceae bacterium]|nr:hypothetical protein [Chitinophagaceae bacterium]